MKTSKLLVVLSVIVVFATGLTACSITDIFNNNPTTTTTVEETVSAVPQTAVIETAKPVKTATVDDLLGKWVSIYSSEDWATISKKGSAYQYKDKDGAFDATFKNGQLIATSGDVTLTCWFNKKTSQMNAKLSNDPTNVLIFKKK